MEDKTASDYGLVIRTKGGDLISYHTQVLIIPEYQITLSAFTAAPLRTYLSKSVESFLQISLPQIMDLYEPMVPDYTDYLGKFLLLTYSDS